MQRWKQEFVGNAHRKCVQINCNGVFDQGKILYMEPDWDCLDLLHAASQRLDIIPAAQKIFNADGAEIDDCMMIVDDDILFFSKDEDFIPPQSNIIDNNIDKNRNDNDRLPYSVGGYIVGELLGRGGFGEVRTGDHQLTSEKVALKFLKKAEIHSLGAAERTNTEIQCLATLKHHNIIKLLQHLETPSHVVLVFELMAGGDLLRFLLRRGGLINSPTQINGFNNNNPNNNLNNPQKSPSQKITPSNSFDDSSLSLSEQQQQYQQRNQNKCVLNEDEGKYVFYQILSGISYAHNQHICHRDLKLENILLKDNTLALVKLADFGLSDFYRPGATMKSTCGTLSFLAPEVFKGTSNAGPPLDVWSLGVILFAMLCGRLPFEGPDLIGTKRPREQIIKTRITKNQYKIDEQLTPEAKDLIRRMLQIDPNERASLPEIFNHVWVRPAISGNFADILQSQAAAAAMQNTNITPTRSSILDPTNNTTATTTTSSNVNSVLLPTLHNNISTKTTTTTNNTISVNTSTNTTTTTMNVERDEDTIGVLERADSLPTGAIKHPRHRGSLSMGAGPHALPRGRSFSVLSTTATSSTNDLQALVAQAQVLAAAETDIDMTTSQQHQAQYQPLSPIAATGGSSRAVTSSGIRDPLTTPPSRVSQARLSFSSPSKEINNYVTGSNSRQNSFTGLDGAVLSSPPTPRGHSTSNNSIISSSNNHTISPCPADSSPPPMTMSNKAFKLIPLRRQHTNEGLMHTEYSSPSGKARSNSTSDALNAAGQASLLRPITGRRPGQSFCDYDDDDDTYTSSNWRNITLDPSPTTTPMPPPCSSTPISGGSRKIVSATTAGTSTKGSTTANRRESMSHSRASSSSSLNTGNSTTTSTTAAVVGTGTTSSNINGKDRTPPPPSTTSNRYTNNTITALTSAAAAVASLTLSNDNLTISSNGYSNKHHHQHQNSNSPLPAHHHHGNMASNTGIAAITPIPSSADTRRSQHHA